jgi:hypothetical protein
MQKVIDYNKEDTFAKFQNQWLNASLVLENNSAQKYLDNICIEKNKKFSLLVEDTNFRVNVWNVLLNIFIEQLARIKILLKKLINLKQLGPLPVL